MDDKDKLVTLAIHTITSAQSLQHELAENGIESVLHNVGDFTDGDMMRVRIKESDLSKALAVVESMRNADAVSNALREELQTGGILVPVDFSEYSWRACRFAFDMAYMYHVSVVFIHSYIDETKTHNILENVIGGIVEKKMDVQQQLNAEKENERKLSERIQQSIESKELPNVNYSFVLREGIPEDEILKYASSFQPSIIIMGTRGRNQKDAELVGSVTAEIIERTKIPVLAIPENASIHTFSDIHHIAFATRFEDADLKAFDKLMSLFKPYNFKVHFIHFAACDRNSQDELWSEIKLSGIREYFSKTYPELDFECNLLKGNDVLNVLDEFVHEKQIDVVSLTTHRRSLFVRMFNPSIAKRMVFHSDTPMLVFHV